MRDLWQDPNCDGRMSVMTPAANGVEVLMAVPVAAHAATAGAHDPLVIHKRDKVILEVSVGSSHVERQATALQNAHTGQMLFVRTDDGEVITVRAEQAP